MVRNVVVRLPFKPQAMCDDLAGSQLNPMVVGAYRTNNLICFVRRSCNTHRRSRPVATRLENATVGPRPSLKLRKVVLLTPSEHDRIVTDRIVR
jgi:hypothetical protein